MKNLSRVGVVEEAVEKVDVLTTEKKERCDGIDSSNSVDVVNALDPVSGSEETLDSAHLVVVVALLRRLSCTRLD